MSSLAGLHPLVLRQLRRLGLDAGALPPTLLPWQGLLDRVSNAYREADQDRYLLERSQEISARELQTHADAVRTNEARLASLLLLSSDWVWEIDTQGRVSFVSEGWQAATGIAASTLLGLRMQQVPGLALRSDEALRLNVAIRKREPFRDVMFDLLRPDGKQSSLRMSGAPMADAAGRFMGFRGVGSDVTEATRAARRAEHMARYDSLTGLPNRGQLLQTLEQTLEVARRRRRRVAVLFIDLDGFKHINDNLGHAAGDELLRVMARRLTGALRQGDMVARLGGDEFVVMMELCGDADPAQATAQRLLALIAESVSLEGRSYELSGSAGISVFPDDADNVDTLMRHADAAMYVAKERGKNGFHTYTGELAARAADLFALATDLRGAILRDELALHYQPKYHLGKGHLTGVEALVRWHHPQRGLVMPGDFVPLAERSGLILPLGRWVLDAACRQIRRWRDAAVDVHHCAINLSPQQINTDGLVDDVQAALQRWGVSPAALEVEITESTVMRDPIRARHILEQLSALGLRISIDDFGTGYSSLSYLKRFPADALKLDRSFIQGLPGDGKDVAITRAVVEMAHGLGMQVVAEGVEQPAQLVILRELRCDQAQGYLLGRPVPADQLSIAPRAQESPLSLMVCP